MVCMYICNVCICMCACVYNSLSKLTVVAVLLVALQRSSVSAKPDSSSVSTSASFNHSSIPLFRCATVAEISECTCAMGYIVYCFLAKYIFMFNLLKKLGS